MVRPGTAGGGGEREKGPYSRRTHPPNPKRGVEGKLGIPTKKKQKKPQQKKKKTPHNKKKKTHPHHTKTHTRTTKKPQQKKKTFCNRDLSRDKSLAGWKTIDGKKADSKNRHLQGGCVLMWDLKVELHTLPGTRDDTRKKVEEGDCGP